VDEKQTPGDTPFTENGAIESVLLQIYGTVTPRNRPEDFQQVREEIEREIAEEVISETKE